MAAASRAAVVAAVLAAAGCGSSPHAGGCRAADLAVKLGSGISEETGQHTLELDLRNPGSACTIDGYPTIRFYDPRGGELPFRYSHKGDQMIPAQTPKRIHLATGGRARFLVNKYRCDLKTVASATSVLVELPSDPTSRLVRLPTGSMSIDYCPQSLSLTVDVSPVTGPVP